MSVRGNNGDSVTLKLYTVVVKFFSNPVHHVVKLAIRSLDCLRFGHLTILYQMGDRLVRVDTINLD